MMLKSRRRLIRISASFRLPPVLKLPGLMHVWWGDGFTASYCNWGHHYYSPERGVMWKACPQCAYDDHEIAVRAYDKWLARQLFKVQVPARKIRCETTACRP
jgi:hypothetical protein